MLLDLSSSFENSLPQCTLTPQWCVGEQKGFQTENQWNLFRSFCSIQNKLMRILALFIIDTDFWRWEKIWTAGWMSHCLDWKRCKTQNQSVHTWHTRTHTHIIEEAGFLSLLLSNRGSYRAKSPWWQADVELGRVGGKKGNLWERCVSSRRRRRRRRCSGVHLLFLDVVNLSVYVPHMLSLLSFCCLFSCLESDLMMHLRWLKKTYL